MHSRWTRWDDRYKAGLMLALLTVTYLLPVLVLLPRHVFFVGDEGEKVIVVASSVRSGDWWRVHFEYPGLAFDPEIEAFFSPWMRVVNGQPVPYHLSTMNFLNAPLYALFGLDGLYVWPLLSGIITAWLAYRLACMMALPHPWVVIPLVGVCTPVFFYSLITWDHMPTVLYSTLIVYLLARQARQYHPGEMVAAGALMGLGLWTRLDMYLFVPATLLAYLYVFRRRRGVWQTMIPLALGLTVVIAAMIAQHIAVYGRFSLIAWETRLNTVTQDTPNASSLPEIVRGLIARQVTVLLMLTVYGSEFWLDRVFLALAFAATVLVFRVPRLQRHSLLTMGSALMQVIGTALAFVHTQMYAIVGLVPTLPLSAVGLAHASARSDEELPPSRLALELIATLTILFLLFSLFLLATSGGVSWGPRYMAELFPLLAIMAWANLTRAHAATHADAQKAVQIAFALVTITSLVVQCVGVSILFEKKAQMNVWYANLKALPVEFVLSDEQYYLQEMAALYFEYVFLCPRTQEVYNRLLERMYAGGVRQFAWVSSVDSKIEPQIKTAQFAVRQTQGCLYEILPTMAGGNE